jgi:hypothetical protein
VPGRRDGLPPDADQVSARGHAMPGHRDPLPAERDAVCG